ncbi:hypothetical protein [Paenibacillus sp. GCM10027628]|uniref:hypothetical protein n=1 Tax=Paenibacillus sp. GCM10027628 TaxID=3273413 RepID=UPI0036D34972
MPKRPLQARNPHSSGGFRSVAPFWGATGKNRREPAPESAEKAVTGSESTLKRGISIRSALLGRYGQNRREPVLESAEKAVTGEKSTLKRGISICSALLGRYGQESARAGARKYQKGSYRREIRAQARDHQDVNFTLYDKC